jgi:membrane-associated protease RseP (regulator of RpoE activity)
MGFVNWVRTQWDRAAALAAMLVGLLALLLGWIGVSGNSYVANQLPYVVSGALFGIFMIGIAAAIWLSADLRDEWRELRGIRVELHAQTVAGLGGNPFANVSDEHTQTIPAVFDTVVDTSGLNSENR